MIYYDRTDASEGTDVNKRSTARKPKVPGSSPAASYVQR